MSQRYFDAPNWSSLLKQLADENPRSSDYAYYRQQFGNDFPQIGTKLSQNYSEWAWNEAKLDFDPELFSEYNQADIFLKTKIANLLIEKTPKGLEYVVDEDLIKEIQALIQIRPHSIITTNYDTFLENLFNEYSPVIGEDILHNQYSSIGEIFKIHGCVSEPESIVINENDYERFMRKKKYLTAKLLTYFLEHPLIILGYSASDPNIQAILSDIDEILASKNQLVENIYIVTFKGDLNVDDTHPKEKLVRLKDGKSIRVKNIYVQDKSPIS